MKLIMKIKKIHTEHSYVQHPFFKCEDYDRKIFNKFLKILSALLVPYFYKNHFVFECVDENGNTYYIGYNDNIISIGSKIGCLPDSKTFEVVSNNFSAINLC